MDNLFTSKVNEASSEMQIKFSGRMDTIASGRMEEALSAALDQFAGKPGWKLEFDLEDVDYIASSFIRICVKSAKLAGAGNFSIINCQPFIKKTFKVSGLDSVLNIV